MNVVKLLPLLRAAGCAAVGPDYERPQMALQQDFVGGTSGPVAQVAAKAWWQDYRDPMLSDLIARGLGQNLDVAAARERIRQAEANLRATGVNAALGSRHNEKMPCPRDGTGRNFRCTSNAYRRHKK